MKDNNIVWHSYRVTKQDREKIKHQKACVLWFTGLSGSGKSTIANEVENELFKMGYHTYLLDGDNIRHGLNKDLGFDDKNRVENIRRISEVAKLFLDSGTITLSAFISPFIDDRQKARDIIGSDFIEVFIDTPFEECAKRDPKGLYKKALNGEIKNFTGLDSPYEKPLNPDVHIDTVILDIKSATSQIISYLNEKGYLCKKD
jgi:adenylylsulfate kinase